MALASWDTSKKIKIIPGTGLVPSTQTNIALPIVLRDGSGITSFDCTPLFDDLAPVSSIWASSHSEITISPDSLTITNNISTPTWRSALGNFELSGKVYFEITPNTDGTVIGVAPADITLAEHIGETGNLGFGYYGTNGNKYHNGTPTAYGDAFASGDVIGVAVDSVAGKVWFSKNGVWQNSGDPAAGTGAAYDTLSEPVFIGGSLYILNTTCTLPGMAGCVYQAPAGFKALADGKPYYEKLALEIGDTGNQCYIEVPPDQWDASNEKAVIFAKLPELKTDSLFYLYYDSTHADNDTYVGVTGSVPAKTVWTNGYAAVVIPQDPSGTVLDSVTGNTVTVNGSMGALVDNPFGGKSFVFDGTDDWLIIPHHSGLDATSVLTLDVFYDQSTIDLAAIINKGPFNGTSHGDYILTQDVSNWYFRLNNSTTEGSGQVTGGSPSAGWLNTVSVYNSTIQSIYYNGVLNNTAGYTTPIGTNAWDLYIGAGWDSSLSVTGKIAFASVSLAERSADWIAVSNKAIRDILFIFSPAIEILTQFLDQLYDLTPEILKQFLDQEYDLMNILKHYLDQEYGQTIAIYLAMYYGDAPAIRTFLEQRYQDLPLVKAILDMPYEDLLTLRAYLDQPYHLPQGLVAMMEQKYGINEAELRVILDQNYDISSLNPIAALLNQVYGLQGDRSVDYIATSLTINGKVIPIRAVSGDCSIDNFCITIDVTLADYADYLRINIDDSAIFVNGPDTYNLIIYSKQRSRASVANTSYQVFLKSPRIDLQSPRSKTFTHEYPTGNAETIAEGIVGEEIDWQTVGFPILANKLYANDETEIDIVRKIIRTVGAKLQSNPDGSLRVIPEYPIPVNKWDSPDYFMTDTADFVSQDESFQHNTGFNRFIIRNENTPEDRIWTEQEEITAYKKKVLAFQTPWDSAAQFELIHSGGSPVPAPVYQGVVQVTQPAEQVEFVAGFANTSRPIYSNLQVKWLRENLGNIVFSEDGKLEAELKTGTTEGYSLAEVTYTTKYHLWHVSDLLDESVQYILREIINE